MHRIVLKLKVSYCTKKEYFTLSFESFWNFSSFNRSFNWSCEFVLRIVTKEEIKKRKKVEKQLYTGEKCSNGCARWYTKDYGTPIQNHVCNWYQSQCLNRQQYLECTLLAESYAITIHCLSTHCERLTMWNGGHEAEHSYDAPCSAGQPHQTGRMLSGCWCSTNFKQRLIRHGRRRYKMDVILKHRFVQRSSTRAVSDEISIARL